MSRARHLDVWFGQQIVGTLANERGQLRFKYHAEIVQAHGLGVPLLSASLPTSVRPASDTRCRPFFDGLLPEGEARRIIAYDLGLTESDTFGMLGELGRDCAGALSIQTSGTAPPITPRRDRALPLTEHQLAAKIANLRSFPLGVDNDIRVSLGGVQEKLLLTQRTTGWGLPAEGSASTHLLKPERPDLPGNVISEALCLRTAAELGVKAATVELATIRGATVLIVERFDRTIEANGTITRQHQENGCQALAVRVGAAPRKYEQSGGPSLARLASVLARWADPAERHVLLAQTAINILVGNADGHAMNTSFRLDKGTITVSPVYDVFSSLLYDVSPRLGMYVNGVSDLRDVNRSDLVAEGVSWGIPQRTATEIINQIFDTAPAAVAAAAAATPEANGPISEFLLERAQRLKESS